MKMWGDALSLRLSVFLANYPRCLCYFRLSTEEDLLVAYLEGCKARDKKWEGGGECWWG